MSSHGSSEVPESLIGCLITQGNAVAIHQVTIRSELTSIKSCQAMLPTPRFALQTRMGGLGQGRCITSNLLSSAEILILAQVYLHPETITGFGQSDGVHLLSLLLVRRSLHQSQMIICIGTSTDVAAK